MTDEDNSRVTGRGGAYFDEGRLGNVPDSQPAAAAAQPAQPQAAPQPQPSSSSSPDLEQRLIDIHRAVNQSFVDTIIATLTPNAFGFYNVQQAHDYFKTLDDDQRPDELKGVTGTNSIEARTVYSRISQFVHLKNRRTSESGIRAYNRIKDDVATIRQKLDAGEELKKSHLKSDEMKELLPYLTGTPAPGPGPVQPSQRDRLARSLMYNITKEVLNEDWKTLIDGDPALKDFYKNDAAYVAFFDKFVAAYKHTDKHRIANLERVARSYAVRAQILDIFYAKGDLLQYFQQPANKHNMAAALARRSTDLVMLSGVDPASRQYLTAITSRLRNIYPLKPGIDQAAFDTLTAEIAKRVRGRIVARQLYTKDVTQI